MNAFKEAVKARVLAGLPVEPCFQHIVDELAAEGITPHEPGGVVAVTTYAHPGRKVEDGEE